MAPPDEILALSANNTRLSPSAIGNRFMFTGRERSELGGRDVDGQAERPSERERTSQWIEELQIYDYRHRFYLPAMGRFLQTDPIGLQTEGAKLSAGQKALFSPDGSAPEAFGSSETNLYRYCGDNPVDGSDPLGLMLLVYDRDPKWRAERVKEIDKLRDSSKLWRDVINELASSSQIHVIVRYDGGGNNITERKWGDAREKETLGTIWRDQKGDAMAHIFPSRSGSLIKFDATKEGTKWGPRPNFVAMAHELGHALDMDRGTYRYIKSVNEGRAIWWENEARALIPMKPRGYDEY